MLPAASLGGGPGLNPEALVLAAFAGAGVGALAGLVPGLHPNALAVVATGALGAGPGEAALAWAAALVAMELAHQFVALVPASLLGAPAPDDALRALPAQELLREGRATEAMRLAAKGAAVGVAVAMALLVPLRLLLGPAGAAYDWLEPALPVVLLAVAAVLLGTEDAEVPWRRALLARPFAEAGLAEVRGALVAREAGLLRLDAGPRKVWVRDPTGSLDRAALGDAVVARGTWVRVPGPGSRALGVAGAMAVFALAAGLGLAAQRIATPSPFGLPGGSPMFPLLSGLFGTPSLLLALRSGHVPEQPDRPDAEPLRDVAGAGAAGAACGALVGLLPGMSSSAASVLAMVAAPSRSREGVLVTLSAAGAGAAVFTSAAFVLVGRARSGAMLAVAQWVQPEPWLGLAPPPLLAVLLLGCATGALVGFAGVQVAGRLAARVIHAVPYASLSAGVLLLLSALVFAFTGIVGLGVLAVATAVGLLPWKWGLRKGHLMGCTMGPLLVGGLGGIG